MLITDMTDHMLTLAEADTMMQDSIFADEIDEGFEQNEWGYVYNLVDGGSVMVPIDFWLTDMTVAVTRRDDEAGEEVVRRIHRRDMLA